MRTTKAQWIAVLTVALSTGAEARAHGFVFSGGFAPPPPPPGLGAPGTPSNGPSGFPGSSGAGGGSGATPPAPGGTTAPPPAGGGGGGTPGVGGSTPGVGGGPAGGGTPRSSGSGPVGGGSGPTNGGNGGAAGGGNGRPSGRPAIPAGAGRGTGGTPAGGGRSFGGAVAARPPAEPWLDEMRIEWNAEFLPYDKTDQYAAVAVSAQEALRRPVDAGGWRRADRPTLVVFVDAADPTHAKALRALDSDHRLRVATKLFNCFRVDAGSKSLGGEIGFAAFRADGTSVGEVKGPGKPSRIYELLAKAFSEDGRGELGAVCNAADPLVKHSAHCRWLLRKASAAVVCPDCGELREDVAENVRQLKDRRADAERRIDELAETRRG